VTKLEGYAAGAVDESPESQHGTREATPSS
jgi:hypothetical protein